MKTYQVDVVKDEGWWIMHARIPRTIIYSQARRIGDIEFMIRDAIAGALDVDPQSFAIELTFERRALPSVTAHEDSGGVSRDPVALAEAFIEHVTSTPPEQVERDLLRASVERIRVSGISS